MFVIPRLDRGIHFAVDQAKWGSCELLKSLQSGPRGQAAGRQSTEKRMLQPTLQYLNCWQIMLQQVMVEMLQQTPLLFSPIFYLSAEKQWYFVYIIWCQCFSKYYAQMQAKEEYHQALAGILHDWMENREPS